jgi:hypothetical protein
MIILVHISGTKLDSSPSKKALVLSSLESYCTVRFWRERECQTTRGFPSLKNNEIHWLMFYFAYLETLFFFMYLKRQLAHGRLPSHFVLRLRQ